MGVTGSHTLVGGADDPRACLRPFHSGESQIKEAAVYKGIVYLISKWNKLIKIEDRNIASKWKDFFQKFEEHSLGTLCLKTTDGCIFIVQFPQMDRGHTGQVHHTCYLQKIY